MYLRHANPGIRVVKLTVENPALQDKNITFKLRTVLIQRVYRVCNICFEKQWDRTRIGEVQAIMHALANSQNVTNALYSIEIAKEKNWTRRHEV